jgi:hypothetical protein
MRFKIAVLSNGWVLVGVVEDDNEQALVFSTAATIRVWGTTKGIGQLAQGPLSATKVDLIPMRTKVEKRALLFDFEATGWESVEAT